MIIWILIIAALLIGIGFFNQKIKKLQKELSAAQIQLKNQEIDDKKKSDSKIEIWHALNAVHMYASLSEEEAKLQSVKDKQKLIMEICGELLKDEI